jgi:hypothetical protein
VLEVTRTVGLGRTHAREHGLLVPVEVLLAREHAQHHRALGFVERMAEMVAVGIGDRDQGSGRQTLERPQERVPKDPRMPGPNPARRMFTDLRPTRSHARTERPFRLSRPALPGALACASVAAFRLVLALAVRSPRLGCSRFAYVALLAGAHGRAR